MRHYSRRTEEAYTAWIRRYILFHKKRHPGEIGAAEVSAFLADLAVRQRLSASTENQALSGLLFLYREVLRTPLPRIEVAERGKMPKRLPVVLSRDEVRAVLRQLQGTMRLIAALLYGTGLRLGECLELRVKDLDFDRHAVVVRRGKGQKDRTTPLPAALVEPLRTHLDCVRRQHELDLRAGVGRVVLPEALDRKYPKAAAEWRWQFVFPAARICTNPAYGPPSRFHLHESVVQKAMTAAVRAAGLTKRASCHSFRSVSTWYPPLRDASFQRQFVLSTDRAWEFAAVVDGLDASLHPGPLQIDALDHPRGTLDDLCGGQHAVGDEMFDDRIADAELARDGLQR